MKDTVERMYSRLNETEECTDDLEDRIKEITQLEKQKKKSKFLKWK